MDDNQATITIILKGDSEKMRHTDRTQRISFGWLKQQFEHKLFNMINVRTKEQVADTFTKPFADKSKWDHAMKLINHVRVDMKLKSGGKDFVSKPHLTAIASIPTSRSIDQAEDLATRFVEEQDFSDTALNHMLTVVVQDSVKFYSFGLRPGQDYKHLTKATLKYPTTTIFFNKCVASRTSNNWTRLVIKTKALTPNDDASTEVYRTTTSGGTTVRLLSMNHDNLTSKEHQALLPLSFRTDDTHFAAPAQTRPRPLDACNRVIVEFCYAEDSKRGEKRNASKGCYVIRVTEKDDATKQSTIKRLCKDLRPLLCDEGGYKAQSKQLLLWASLPCTGGCSWQHINILTNRERVEDHHELFLKLLKSLKAFMRIMKPFKPELAMELPKTCDYWKWTVVQRTMGVGAQGSMQYNAGANATSTARLLYLRADPAELLRANLISSSNDPCMAVSWLGERTPVNRLITFGQSTIAWDSEAPPFEKTKQSALQYLRHIVDADTAAAERTASK